MWPISSVKSAAATVFEYYNANNDSDNNGNNDTLASPRVGGVQWRTIKTTRIIIISDDGRTFETQ